MSLLKKINHRNQAGFTLLEILLVVGIISILAGIVILAINPTKQLGDTRNAQRRSDVLTILNAVYQYSIDNNGWLPASTTLPTLSSNQTCIDNGTEINNGDSSSGSRINLYDNLVESSASSTYLVSIPRDPQATSTADAEGSGYNIAKTTSGRVTVCAPLAENEVVISVTR
jgi:type IV pilus assembly protein PilA